MLGRLTAGLTSPILRNKDEYVELLYRERLLFLAIAFGTAFYLWLFAGWSVSLMYHPVPAASDARGPAIALVAAGAAAILHRRVSLAGTVLTAGMVGALFMWPNPARYMLAPALVCVAGLLLSRGMAAVTALALSALPGIPKEGVLALWISTGAFWLASDYVYASLRLACERQRHAYSVERELLSRRGELRRANDSLRVAYALLERTNRELAEARDEAQEARRLKSQFAATISHELRTPLNLILGFAELMHKMPELYGGAVLTPELRGDIREIYRSTKHLLELVDDVLDLSRVEQVRLALVPEDTDIAALVQEAVNTVSGLFRSKPVELRVDVPPDLPSCLVDRTRIRQVLINLLANAARFTERGEVAVLATLDEPHGEIVVCVSDTGPGIEEQERARVFDAFYQVAGPLRRQPGGTGLGLAICRTFVQMHGGRIWLDSGGQGSRFSFSIPLRPVVQAAGDWRMPVPPDPLGDSIVTVDADGRLAGMLACALPGLGVHNVADPNRVPGEVERWHPKAVVAFPDKSEMRPARDIAPWPGLPVICCRLTSTKPLSAYANVRAVVSKPIAAKDLLHALSSLGPVRSLVVADDDEGMARLIQRSMSVDKPHVSLHIAHDGLTALRLLRDLRPDAAILDLAMPEMDGLEVLKQMAEDGLADIPVLVLTATDVVRGSVTADQLVVSSCLGLGEAELARYVEALARAARPRYGVQPAA